MSSGEESDPAQPMLKKAQSEAPKLSSLLLANRNNKTPSKQSTEIMGNFSPPILDNTRGETDFNISSSTNVTRVNNTGYINQNSEIVKSEDLPAIIPSGVSVTKIHNSKSLTTTFNLGSGMTITSQTSNYHSLANGVQPVSTTLKKANQKLDSTPKKRKRKNTNNISPAVHQDDVPFSSSAIPDDVACRELYMKLMANRLEHEDAEHKARMELIEKQINLCSQQSSYWSLKMKFLKNNKDLTDMPMVNGDAFI